jgi:hypothetical protein
MGQQVGAVGSSSRVDPWWVPKDLPTNLPMTRILVIHLIRLGDISKIPLFFFQPSACPKRVGHRKGSPPNALTPKRVYTHSLRSARSLDKTRTLLTCSTRSLQQLPQHGHKQGWDGRGLRRKTLRPWDPRVLHQNSPRRCVYQRTELEFRFGDL